MIVPLEHRGLLVDRMPESADRIVGVPIVGGNIPVVLNLQERFEVKPLPGSPAASIPLAATIGRHISVIGFDASAAVPSTDGGTGNLNSIHVARFATDLYHVTMVVGVEKLPRACEAVGIEVDSFDSVGMPSLRRRSVEALIQPLTGAVPGS